MNSILFIFSALFALAIPSILIIASIVLLLMKIIERKKEKKNEDFDKYDKY